MTIAELKKAIDKAVADETICFSLCFPGDGTVEEELICIGSNILASKLTKEVLNISLTQIGGV